MPVTDDVVGVVIPLALTLPVKTDNQTSGKAGNIFISGGKIMFNPSDGGAPETVTSS